jgi:outer membrane biosynthesis protein TonB
MEPHITQVQLPPPPPPPPPPKTPPPPQKKEVETTRPKEATPQKASTPAPKAPSPPAAVQTSVAGNGPSALGAGNGGGGDCVGQGCGNGDGTGGDNDAYYRNLVQTQIQEALRRDDKLRFAKFRMTVAFSLDASGHVAHATVSSFSGDDDVQAEVERVLHDISTGDTPPAEMQAKQFSVRITAQTRG